jgi:rod shape-determining protein MreC
MCALTPDGVVGIVTKVDPFQSLVYTLHHTQCRIGAMVQRNRALGVVHGSGSDLSHVCRMEYIDMKDEVFEGDIVVTSGSAVFPRGLPLGRVTRVRDEGALLKTAYIEPFAQPYQIDEVFLVRRVQPSQEELAAFTPPDPRADDSGGHAMPDTRPLQERWAP